MLSGAPVVGSELKRTAWSFSMTAYFTAPFVKVICATILPFPGRTFAIVRFGSGAERISALKVRQRADFIKTG
jgi:hypothetical protein